MSPATARIRLILAVLVLAAGAAVSACGGDDDSPPDETPERTSAAGAAATQEPAAPESTPASAAAGPTNEEPVVVASADGRATIDVPAGALPAGVEPGELSVQDVTEREVQTIADALASAGIVVSEDGFQLVAAYDFGPDGAQFERPITFSLTLPLSQSALIGFVVSGNGLEAITEFETEIDAEGKSVTISISLDHFSGVRWLGTRSSFTVALAPNPLVPALGETILVTAIVTRRASTLDLDGVGLYVNGELPTLRISAAF